MKIRYAVLLGGLVLLCANLAMAGASPGVGYAGNRFAVPALSSCMGDFGSGMGMCMIFEEPDNPETQDFNLGSPFIGTGLVSILDPNGSLSDSLDFYLNSDGNVHVLFQSEGFAQAGGAPTFEDAAGNWCWLCGVGNNVYMGVSPAVPEPSSLLLLGSGVLGLAGVIRRKLF